MGHTRQHIYVPGSFDETTRMNPNLEFAQAIHGRTTGRGIGIIDAVHLVEVARAARLLEGSKFFASDVGDKVRRWFSEYLSWMQVAEFARYTGNTEMAKFCRKRFTSVLVPNQIAPNGSFPLELARTKPYAYSLFNLDALATACHILSPNRTPFGNLHCRMAAACERHWNTCFPTLRTRRTGSAG